jgi:hypothetical protein
MLKGSPKFENCMKLGQGSWMMNSHPMWKVIWKLKVLANVYLNGG